MTSISGSDYKKLSDCAARLGLGIGNVFDTANRDSYHKFSSSFKKASSGLDKVKLMGCYAAHWLTGQFKESYLHHRAVILHAETTIPIMVRAFGEDVVAKAVALEDRSAEIVDLCMKTGHTSLARIVKYSLSI